MSQKTGSWTLTRKEREFFEDFRRRKRFERQPQVLWGWKRDRVVAGRRFPESRTVYFSADLGLRGSGELGIERAYFFLESRATDSEIARLKRTAGKSRKLTGLRMQVSTWQDRKLAGYGRLRLEIGTPTPYDRATVARRVKGRPRTRIDPPQLTDEAHDCNIRHLSPFVIYCGSGLSSESGLPFLGSLHTLFQVDDPASGQLIFGARDRLPGRVTRDVRGTFRRFCDFTVQAIKAEPSTSHRSLAELLRKGIVVQVLTDNVDDILRKVGIPYSQTRLSIFPDRFPVTFDSRARSLLVVGVSVDRRDVVKQARRMGLAIVIINPALGVAPHSRNLDYLQKGDMFFRGRASDILPKIVKASGFSRMAKR